jgi:hypothetical protein
MVFDNFGVWSLGLDYGNTWCGGVLVLRSANVVKLGVSIKFPSNRRATSGRYIKATNRSELLYTCTGSTLPTPLGLYQLNSRKFYLL